MRLFKLATIVGLGIVFGVAIYLSQTLFASTPQKLAANNVEESELLPHDAVVLENLHRAIPVSRHAESKTESHHHAESAHQVAANESSQYPSDAANNHQGSSDATSSLAEEDASSQIRPDVPSAPSAVATPASVAPSAAPAGVANPHVQFAMTDTNSNTPRTKTIVDR